MSNILQNRTVKNAEWLIGGRIAQTVINLLLNMLCARYLGPDNFGLLSYANVFAAFFMSVCTLGINSVLVNEFINSSEKDGCIIGTSLVLKAISSFFSALIIVCIVSVVDADEPTTIAVVALSSIGVIFQVFETVNYWFQSRLQSKVTAIATLIAFVITAGYKIILILLKKNVILFGLATSVDYIFIAIFLMAAYFKYGGEKLSFSWKYGKKLLSKSHHFILSGLMVVIYGQTDKFMLKQMLGNTETGYYATAISLGNAWCFILSAIIDSVYPSIMEADGKDQEEFKRRNKQLYAIVFYLSMTVSVIYMIFSPLAIKILYGESYLPAVAPLRIITWYVAFAYLGVARNAWIVCKNKQFYLKYVYASAAVMNVILNLFLIPRFGTVGAAIASLISQIVTSIVLPLFIKELRENSIMMLEAVLLKGIRKK